MDSPPNPKMARPISIMCSEEADVPDAKVSWPSSTRKENLGGVRGGDRVSARGGQGNNGAAALRHTLV
eukprot:scaffold127187_cov29-Tisochrysis_lutea.AAC.3